MAVTNVKSTFLAKLLGQTNDKKNLPEEGMMGNPVNPGLRFQNESPLFGPQGLGASSQVPTTPQQSQPKSRYNLFEMTQPRPTRDTESEEIIKKRARINALGAGISGLAGLASMKMGGDVAQPVDLVTPWNMDQTRMLDQDYRGRLQNWIDQGFQVNQANTELQNREIEQDFAAENRMAQINAQGQNKLEEIEARLAADMEKFKAKTFEEKAKELRGVGIDINSPNAYQEFLKIRREKVKADLDNIKASIGYKNRYGVGKAGGQNKTFDIPKLQKGRQALLNQYDQQIKDLNSKLTGITTKDAPTLEQIKQLNAEKKRYYDYNPGSNEILDAEIMDAAYGNSEQGGGTPQVGSNGTQQGAAFPFDPERGFTNVPRDQDPILNQANQPGQPNPELQGRISQGLQLIESGEASDDDFEMILQDIVDAGEAEDLDAAFQLVYKLLKGNEPIIPPN